MSQVEDTMKRFAAQELREEGQQMEAANTSSLELSSGSPVDLVYQRVRECANFYSSWHDTRELLQKLVADGQDPREQGRTTQIRELLIQLSRTLCECHGRLGGVFAECVDEMAEGNEPVMPSYRSVWHDRYCGADFVDTVRRSGIDLGDKETPSRIITPSAPRERTAEPPSEKQMDKIEEKLSECAHEDHLRFVQGDLAHLWTFADTVLVMARRLVDGVLNDEKMCETGKIIAATLDGELIHLNKMLVIVKGSVPPNMMKLIKGRLPELTLREAEQRHFINEPPSATDAVVEAEDGGPLSTTAVIKVSKPYFVQLERANKYLIDVLWASAMILDYVPRMVSRLREITHNLEKDDADKVDNAMSHISRLAEDLGMIDRAINIGPDGDKIRQNMAKTKDISSHRDPAVLRKIEGKIEDCSKLHVDPTYLEWLERQDSYFINLMWAVGPIVEYVPTLLESLSPVLDLHLPNDTSTAAGVAHKAIDKALSHLENITNELARHLKNIHASPDGDRIRQTLSKAGLLTKSGQGDAEDATALASQEIRGIQEFEEKSREVDLGPIGSPEHLRPRGQHQISIVVEGETGSGKSTLAAALEQLIQKCGKCVTLDMLTFGEHKRFEDKLDLADLFASGYWGRIFLSQRNIDPESSVEKVGGALKLDAYETQLARLYVLANNTSNVVWTLARAVTDKLTHEQHYELALQTFDSCRPLNRELEETLNLLKANCPEAIRRARKYVDDIHAAKGSKLRRDPEPIKQDTAQQMLDRQPGKEPKPHVEQTRIIHMSETTLREVMAVVEKARATSSVDAAGTLGTTSVMIDSPFKTDVFEVELEMLPGTQESCGYKLGATGLPMPEPHKDELGESDGEVTP